MRTIIDHATIVTADAGRRVLYDAAIGIEDDQIVALGPSAEVHARLPGAEVVEGRGKAVMPGFANCHTHFTLTLSRGIQEGFPSPPRSASRAPSLLTSRTKSEP